MEPVLRRASAAGHPTFLLLHGRGGAEGDLVPLADALDPEAGVLAPRGPLPEGHGFAWFRHQRIGVPVLQSLVAELERVGGWLESARSDAGDPPVVAIGFSNGAMMAGALAAARPDLVGAAMVFAGAYPLPEEVLAGGGLAGTPLLAVGGGADPFHPEDVMERGIASYRDAGAEVTAVVDPAAGHEITAAQVAEARAWLAGDPLHRRA